MLRGKHIYKLNTWKTLQVYVVKQLNANKRIKTG